MTSCTPFSEEEDTLKPRETCEESARGALPMPEGEGWTPLAWAVAAGDVASLQALLESGADVDELAENGTALMQAASDNSIDAARLLIAAGASLGLVARIGAWAALHFACVKGHAQLAALLIEERAAVNILCAAGRTPLYYAITSARDCARTILLQRGGGP